MSRRNPPRPPLTEAHRRRLALFARWHVAALDAEPEYRRSIDALARRLDLGGLSKAETMATAEALDDLLSEVWDKRPADDDEGTGLT